MNSDPHNLDLCPMQHMVGAYHDGELDASASATLQGHLPGCEACSAELAELQELSTMASDFGREGLSQMGAARVRQAIDRQAKADARPASMRIVGILSGVAASALVVGAAWLFEQAPSTSAPPGQVVLTPTATEPWQYYAMLRNVDLSHSPFETQDQKALVDARTAQLMVSEFGRKP